MNSVINNIAQCWGCGIFDNLYRVVSQVGADIYGYMIVWAWVVLIGFWAFYTLYVVFQNMKDGFAEDFMYQKSIKPVFINSIIVMALLGMGLSFPRFVSSLVFEPVADVSSFYSQGVIRTVPDTVNQKIVYEPVSAPDTGIFSLGLRDKIIGLMKTTVMQQQSMIKLGFTIMDSAFSLSSIKTIGSFLRNVLMFIMGLFLVYQFFKLFIRFFFYFTDVIISFAMLAFFFPFMMIFFIFKNSKSAGWVQDMGKAFSPSLIKNVVNSIIALVSAILIYTIALALVARFFAIENLPFNKIIRHILDGTATENMFAAEDPLLMTVFGCIVLGFLISILTKQIPVIAGEVISAFGVNPKNQLSESVGEQVESATKNLASGVAKKIGIIESPEAAAGAVLAGAAFGAKNAAKAAPGMARGAAKATIAALTDMPGTLHKAGAAVTGAVKSIPGKISAAATGLKNKVTAIPGNIKKSAIAFKDKVAHIPKDVKEGLGKFVGKVKAVPGAVKAGAKNLGGWALMSLKANIWMIIAQVVLWTTLTGIGVWYMYDAMGGATLPYLSLPRFLDAIGACKDGVCDLASANGCFLCPYVQKMFEVIGKAALVLFNAIVDHTWIIMVVGLVVFMFYKAYEVIYEASKKNADIVGSGERGLDFAKWWSPVKDLIIRMLIVASLLGVAGLGGDKMMQDVAKVVIYPVMSVGSSLAMSATGMDKSGAICAAKELGSENPLAGVSDAFMCIIGNLNSVVLYGASRGFSMMSVSWMGMGGGVFTWISGLIVVIMFLFLGFNILFKVLNVVFNLVFIIIFLPLLIASYAFSETWALAKNVSSSAIGLLAKTAVQVVGITLNVMIVYTFTMHAMSATISSDTASEVAIAQKCEDYSALGNNKYDMEKYKECFQQERKKNPEAFAYLDKGWDFLVSMLFLFLVYNVLIKKKLEERINTGDGDSYFRFGDSLKKVGSTLIDYPMKLVKKIPGLK